MSFLTKFFETDRENTGDEKYDRNEFCDSQSFIEQKVTPRCHEEWGEAKEHQGSGRAQFSKSGTEKVIRTEEPERATQKKVGCCTGIYVIPFDESDDAKADGSDGEFKRVDPLTRNFARE